MSATVPVTGKQEGMARAFENADPAWKARAEEAVRVLATRKYQFTTDDVWAAVGFTREGRAMGAIMKRAAADGIVEATDRYIKSARPACHERPVRVWRSLRYIG